MASRTSTEVDIPMRHGKRARRRTTTQRQTIEKDRAAGTSRRIRCHLQFRYVIGMTKSCIHHFHSAIVVVLLLLSKSNNVTTIGERQGTFTLPRKFNRPQTKPAHSSLPHVCTFPPRLTCLCQFARSPTKSSRLSLTLSYARHSYITSLTA